MAVAAVAVGRVKSADECASDDPCTAGDSRLCVQFMDPLDENSEVNSAVLQYCVRSNDWWSASNPLMDIDPMFPAQACQNHDACPGDEVCNENTNQCEPCYAAGDQPPSDDPGYCCPGMIVMPWGECDFPEDGF